MKSRRRSILCSTRATHRGFARTGVRTSGEPKCVACGRMMDPVTDQSLESGQASAALLYPERRMGEEVATKRPSHALDPEKLLRFAQQLYAHTLTLQEVIRNEGELAYEVLRPRCERQAAQQFEIFCRTGDEVATTVDPVASMADGLTG